MSIHSFALKYTLIIGNTLIIILIIRNARLFLKTNKFIS